MYVYSITLGKVISVHCTIHFQLEFETVGENVSSHFQLSFNNFCLAGALGTPLEFGFRELIKVEQSVYNYNIFAC